MHHQRPDTPTPARGFTPPPSGGRRLRAAVAAAAALGYAAALAPLLRPAGAVAAALALLPVLLAAWLLERRAEERAAELGAANRALRESEERYRAFLEHSSEGIWRFEFDPPIPAGLPPEEQIREAYRGGRLAECNDAMARMYGFARAGEIVGARLGDLLPPGEPRNLAYLDAFVRSGYRLLDVESDEVDRDGAPRVFRNSLVGVVEDGVVRRVWGVQRDVTEGRAVEEALRESEARFRAIFAGAPLGVAFADLDGCVLESNPALREMLGYTEEELRSRPFRDYTHPDDVAPNLELLEEARAGKRDRYALEKRCVRKDGGVIWVRLTVSRVPGPEGEAGFLVATVEDVTERREAAEALRQGRERYRALFEGVNDAVFVYGIGEDGTPGPIREVNSVACRHLGYTREELIGRAPLDFDPPEIRAESERLVARLLHEPNVLAERVHVARDGRHVPVEVNARVVELDGRPAVISIVRDVTERKRGEEALRRSEEYFRSLIESVSDVIQVVNEDGTLRFVSPSVRRVLGYGPEELAGARAFELFHPDDLPEAARAFARVLSSPGAEPCLVDVRLRHRDGSWRTCQGVGSNLFGDAGVRGFVVAFRDVTERRATEEALSESQRQLLHAQKMEAVGRLAGGVAHDFNNMLTAIKGFAQLLLLDLPEHDPGRLYADEIQKAADRSAALTRQLLAFSRRQVLQPEVLYLNATVGEMDRMLRRVIGEDVELVTLLDPTLERVRADPGQVEQVLLNLAVNARDAMPAGGKLVIETGSAEVGPEDVRRRPYLRPGRYVALSVRDTGQGMDPEVQTQVFEPFFTTKEQGTGLGLSTVYGIVKQSGGFVWVESEAGRGTCFRILLPPAYEEARSVPHSSAPEGMADGAGTVLLVEDEAAVRLLTRKILQRSGYRVLEAGSGAEAIRIFEEHPGPIDLLLTDVVMPRMGGAELVEYLAPLAPDTRILYMSGYTDEAIVHHGVLDPGTEFIPKPFTPEALTQKVRQVMQGA